MIKQEKTINILRQSYLDYSVERFGMKLDKTILESALKERDESLASCKVSLVSCCKQCFQKLASNHIVSY